MASSVGHSLVPSMHVLCVEIAAGEALIHCSDLQRKCSELQRNPCTHNMTCFRCGFDLRPVEQEVEAQNVVSEKATRSGLGALITRELQVQTLTPLLGSC